MTLDEYQIIKNLTIPKLKVMSPDELDALSAEIRQFLIMELSAVGGHLGPNLGVVELTLALFRSFDSPQDRFFWDIGHQAYVHKIVTGRANKFDTLRQYKGLSGFVKMSESEHDIWESGHASTSLSGAAGLSAQRDIKKENYHVVSIIGDGALTGGMALEALNHIGDLGTPHIIILNDNNMSISKNVGAISKHINELRVNPNYLKAKKGTKMALSKVKVGKYVRMSVHTIKKSMKKMLLRDNDNTFFGTMNIDYLGPIDGHNIEQLEQAMEHAKDRKRPVLLHVMTIKGKGYNPAEMDDKGSWHGIGPYSHQHGHKVRKTDKTLRQWSSVVSETVERLAATDEDIIAVTPAMIKGSKLTFFADKYPNRIFDVGIAEEHAMTFSAGAALGHEFKPFLAIYSTFLQRAYDQLLHDVARQNLPLVIGIDRCGFAGGDGETHHGIYDISIMRTIPKLTIVMGKNAEETQQLVYNAFYHYTTRGPVALRYPRGYTQLDYVGQFQQIEYGTWEELTVGQDIAILAFGPQLETAKEVAAALEQSGHSTSIVNARFIKPMDEAMLHHIFKKYTHIITIEEGSRAGGFGSGVLEFMSMQNYQRAVHVFAIDDIFIEQGDNTLLRKEAGIDADSIIQQMKKRL